MKAVALYNLKGGVGKTTAAVNVAYLAAAAGERVLLWDLDPQGAASFILRVRARVAGFGRKTLQDGAALSSAIKETDFRNLDLLPADFSYRKFDRILDHLGKPARVLRGLLDTFAGDYDVVFLDCPAGFSLLTEAVLETADITLVPTIPTPLSMRTLARILRWADRCGAPFHLAPFLSMVDRRKILHRRACDWSAYHPEVFLGAQIPYASIVEQIAVRRLPLAEFAARDVAATGFVELWDELRTRLARQPARTEQRVGSRPPLDAIESLTEELESAQERESRREGETLSPTAIDVVVHSFDTDDRDLTRSGHVLELREHQSTFVVVAGRPTGASEDASREQVEIDGSWALQILSGQMSPLAVLDRRLGRPGPLLVKEIRAVVGRRGLCRVESRIVSKARPQRSDPDTFAVAATCA
jgi:chromosome partitioning protein